MTLTQTAILTKRFLIALGLTMFFGIVVWASFIIYKANLPKPILALPVPTLKFGVLPQPLFPESSASASNYSFSLDTDTGDLPKDLPTLMKVYVTPQLGASFLAPDRAKTLANKFGFPLGPEILDSNTYRFKDAAGGQITIKLDTNNFQLQRNEASPSASALSRTIEDHTQIIQDFKSFLTSKNLLKPTLSSGKVQVNYENGSQSNSTRAFITLWPSKIDDLEIVTPTYKSGLINATLTKYSSDEDRYIKLNYIYWEPDESTSSTYAIRTPQTAFDDLKNNRGVIILDPKKARISITSVRLAYYEPEEYPTYIQPIYVFEGPNFAAYVPAITSDYLSK